MSWYVSGGVYVLVGGGGGSVCVDVCVMEGTSATVVLEGVWKCVLGDVYVKVCV